VSAGWDRFQDDGAGPDWLAAAGEDASEGKSEVHSPRSASADGAPGWAAEPSADGAPGWAVPAEPGTDTGGPSGWASLADAAGPKSRSAAPERAGQPRKSPAKKSAAKKTSGGWSSRRKDRDPADADKPQPPQSREKLEQRAKNILMYHLGRQMQTRSQLADKLRKKEIPDDVAEAVLDRFEELHLLDDTSYAETFVRSRHTERGLAKRALGYELRKRGIDDETAAEALSTLDEDQEAATARRLVDSRLRATKGLDPQVRTRRLVGMLARKGYSGSIAFRVVKEALAEEGLDVDLGDPGFD